jgi:hypothetical protein
MSVSTKICKKCSLERPLESFWKNARYKDGKEPNCIECKRVSLLVRRDAQLEAQRRWREAHPNYQREYSKTEKSKEYHRQYYREHAEDYKERQRRRRNDNPERETAARRVYLEKNRESMNNYHREWKAKKAETDPQYKLKLNVSRRIRYELHTLNKGRKTSRTMDLIGCSIEDLKAHIERQLASGMSWENYGKVWHIDHRIPCAAWDLTDEFESKCCWNYRNLQPMIASDNRRKKDKYNEDEKSAYMESMRVI